MMHVQEAMTAEADELARTSFGPIMLRAIGRCYVSQVSGHSQHAQIPLLAGYLNMCSEAVICARKGRVGCRAC